MKNYSCPYCPGGNEMTWGFSPEGWEWARQKHEDHKVAPVKQEKKYITLKMPEPRKGEIKLAGGYVVEFYNECGLCSKEVKYGEKHNCQPPKSKGRDDTEYAKGIIKGREMQY